MVRFKYRYLVIEACQAKGKSNMTKDSLFEAMKQSILENFGEYGVGTISSTIQLKYFNPPTNIAIVRVAREHFRLLWSAVTFVVNIGGKEGMMRVLHVGGSMRSCQKSAALYGLGELQIELASVST